MIEHWLNHFLWGELIGGIVLNRIICSVMGAIFIAIGIATIITLNYGMPSFDTFVLIISNYTGLIYTTALRLVQLSMFIILVVLKRFFSLTWTELFVSVISVVVVTTFIDIVLQTFIGSLEKSIVWLIIGFIFYAYGITLLVQSDIFLAPNDKILTAISHRSKHTYAFYKVSSDILMLVFSLIVVWQMDYDISISLTSIFLTFFTGIFVGLFSKLNNIVIDKLK